METSTHKTHTVLLRVKNAVKYAHFNYQHRGWVSKSVVSIIAIIGGADLFFRGLDVYSQWTGTDAIMTDEIASLILASLVGMAYCGFRIYKVALWAVISTGYFVFGLVLPKAIVHDLNVRAGQKSSNLVTPPRTTES